MQRAGCLLTVLLLLLVPLAACKAAVSGASSAVAAVTTAETTAESTGKTSKKTEKATAETEKTKRTKEERTTIPPLTKPVTTKKTRRSVTTRRTKSTKGETESTYRYLTSARAAKPTEKRSFAETVKVACVGDSITKNGYWENNLQGALSKKYTVEGFGVNGATALYFGKDNGNFKAYVDQPEYRKSLSAGADIVVIMLGTNDSKGYNWVSDMDNPRQFIIDTTDLVRSYQQAASAPTVFLALPPTVFNPFAGITNEVIEGSVIPALRQVAKDTGAVLIDTHTATKDAAEHFADGVHPSDAQGKKLIADAVAAAITAHVGKK